MTDHKYIQNQKNYIKREHRIILRDHVSSSCVIVFLLAILIFVSASFEHPDGWQEVSITLESYTTVHTGRGGSRLDIYDTNGNRYTVNRNEGNIKEKLVIGQQYAFVFADGFFHDTVEAIRIGGVEYLNYDDSVKDYWRAKTLFWVLIGVVMLGLVAVNLFVYFAGTSDRIKKIRKYKKRIYNKEHEVK